MSTGESRFRDLQVGDTHLRVDSRRIRSPDPDLFRIEAWREGDTPVTPLPGRSGEAAWAVEGGRKGETWVLRHHGERGLLSQVLGRRRPWRGLEHTRPMKELALLQWMWEEGLPVPTPVGAAVHREGAFYQGAVLTGRVPGVSLLRLLRENRPNPRSWSALGRTLLRFHQAGIWHPDFSAGHILVDGDRVWMVDFEGARKRSPGGWAIRHLGRIRRAAVEALGRDRWLEASWQACWQALFREYRAGQPGKGKAS
ncbi:MAG: 3-deoxy-D-manno-octulosonic acid kinase [Gemmatimonadales bacterium]|nr:MAG: 3-deoxy-D-manno-octulosonic acid kinase [Gemmatimonadales bacterium]